MSEGWLVGLETWNGMRQEEVEVKTRKCAAQTERDTARSADKSRDRQTDGKSVECASAGCDCHQPGSGWAVFALQCRPWKERVGRRKKSITGRRTTNCMFVIYSSKERVHA
jgi:hypothetical protein